MTHLTPAEIVALRDDELEIVSQDRRAHLEGCPPCRQALGSARERARRVAEGLPPAPTLSDEEITGAREAVRARLGDPAHGPGAPASGGDSPEGDHGDARVRPLHRPGWGLGALARAAGLVLLLGGGAAALPGSPVRAWIEEALQDPVAAVGEAPEPSPAAEAAPAPTGETGVRVRVDEGPIAVVVHGAAPGSRIRVVLAQGRELAVFAADGSRFRSSDGQVEVTAAAGPIRVRLPRSVLPATLSANGRVYLRWTGTGLETPGPVVTRGEEEVVFEVGG